MVVSMPHMNTTCRKALGTTLRPGTICAESPDADREICALSLNPWRCQRTGADADLRVPAPGPVSGPPIETGGIANGGDAVTNGRLASAAQWRCRHSGAPGSGAPGRTRTCATGSGGRFELSNRVQAVSCSAVEQGV
jgi:hypothetical protein